MRIINIDKPKGWTSFDTVRFIKRRFQEKKVGHLGTLDPMATGILPIFLGQATRLIPLFNDADKSYRAVCKLGQSTNTFDAEGSVTESKECGFLTPDEVIKAVYTFQGQQIQQTPAFSAAKINGTPSYKLARQGIEVTGKTRSVYFHELEVESVDLPFVQIKIRCSKGTYIRTLADDLGKLLKVGGHLTSLERLACGEWFDQHNSVSIQHLKEIILDTDVPWIFPVDVLNHLHTIISTPDILKLLKDGRRIEIPQSIMFEHEDTKCFLNVLKDTSKTAQTKVLDDCQNIVAIGFVMWENGDCYFQPTKVFVK
ncbi:MAG: tRNA pseudouridine(55) synthase TruB [SAR324 cluster bacterium]|nr:tRNA pseudouridine(55) synthase TruB [SAR324 cluster bacterium]MBL7035336.1 tRNA pseudouridine(55) synthase TruB [SAR324 cluster bacterium]